MHPFILYLCSPLKSFKDKIIVAHIDRKANLTAEPDKKCCGGENDNYSLDAAYSGYMKPSGLRFERYVTGTALYTGDSERLSCSVQMFRAYNGVQIRSSYDVSELISSK
jgi:hypothetical protein